MVSLFGLQVTILQIVEAIPSIIAAIQAIAQVYDELSAQAHNPQSAMSQSMTMLGKAVVGAVAEKSGHTHPNPFTPEEQMIWDRASAMS